MEDWEGVLMVNLNWLADNATPLELNTSVLGNVNSASTNLVVNADNVSGGFFGLGVMICIFVYLIIKTSSQEGAIRMELPRSLQLSSGLTFVVGYLMNISGLVSSYDHALWFFSLFVMATIWVYYLKRSNQ